MKLIKFTSILLCTILLVAIFAGCDTPEESMSDTSSKDPLLNTSEDVSENVSEEISEEVSEEVSQVLDFVIVDHLDAFSFLDHGIIKDNHIFSPFSGQNVKRIDN